MLLLQRLHEENEKLFDRLTEKAASLGSAQVDFLSSKIGIILSSNGVNIYIAKLSFLTFPYAYFDGIQSQHFKVVYMLHTFHWNLIQTTSLMVTYSAHLM